MFFVLRRKDDGELLRSEAGKDGDCKTTKILQKAKLFKLTLEPDHLVTPTDKVTTGTVSCEVEGDRIPAGLSGTWEIVPVDLRLA